MDTREHELRDRIEEIANASASDTRLVTLAVPADRSVGEALERIEEDHAEAEYLDTDATSEPLRDALEGVRRVLQRYDETPGSGLVVYVGVVDGDRIEYVFDDLPSSVTDFVYERSNEFDTAPLETAARPGTTYGLVVIERGGAALGRLDGEAVEPLETFDSDVMGKTKAGGQSADRFERRREEQKEAFFEAVAEAAAREFLADPAADAADSDGDASSEAGTDRAAEGAEAGVTADGEGDGTADLAVDGLLVGGTTVTVDEFVEGGYLDHRLREAIVADLPVEYASEQGLRQLVEKAEDRLAEAERRGEREALDRFFTALEAEDDEVVYGRAETEEALEYEAVETLLVSAALPVEEVRDLEARAAEIGADCVVVPTDTERGTQFRAGFGGVAALLRFPVE